MKVYTGSGDRGKTSLFSGERVSKSDQRVEAYGDVDELTSILGGLAATFLPDQTALIEEIRRIQSDLMHVGAWLSATPRSPAAAELEEITEEYSKALEGAIDRMDEELPPLKDFLLPGGHLSSVWAHMARAVCRRTERNVVRLAAASGEADGYRPLQGVIIYLNRLSDYLFVLARHCNRIQGISDTIWRK